MKTLSLLIDLVTALLGLRSKPTPRVTATPTPAPEPVGSDPWCGWRGLDHVTFWKRMIDIEEGGDVVGRAKHHGLSGRKGYMRVKSTFMEHFGSDPAFMSAMMTARQADATRQMAEAVDGEDLMAPVEGVSLETFATLASSLARMPDDAVAQDKLLASKGLDLARFERVKHAWMSRMRSSTHPMGAAAIAAEYAKHFSGPPAQFDGEPCSVERYAEILGAQGAWADDGRDIHRLLQDTFGITVTEYSDLGMYWNQQMMHDIQLSEQIHDLSATFRAQHHTHTPDMDLAL
jgi:hypothetical protein